ncbi:hypothetical protein AVL61_00780 [Kocuria rosea subsp. polaris]|uniref:DUF262 domain-containing protein n=1 Tax=Kocuria rosea subsp. polaris TaxID=136273 RepID=A0A0W8IMY6_KOCRO|nr:DUF262 domain-containing protein [Kocuria polaris]KUG61495.1 hypothetical protein AVL61_00780 [Kocuria polaris]
MSNNIQPTYRSIKNLLQARTFSIDDYQREYKWDYKNIEELVFDLIGKFRNEYDEGDPTSKVKTYGQYFLGSIIVTDRNAKTYLVDGQQRVTSLTLLLIHLYREAKDRGLGVITTLEPLIYSDDYGEQKFNLDIPERVPVVRALFNGEDYNVEGKDESVRNILARYRDIESFDLANELGSSLANFIYWLVANVGLIEISAGSDTQAYAIFETMNDRGKPLSPVDMLKAYLLAPIEDDENRRHANKKWRETVLRLNTSDDAPDMEQDAACIKAWLRAQYSESTRERRAGAVDQDWELIGSVFHRWVRDRREHIGVGDENANFRLMTEEFPFFARAFALVRHAGQRYTAGLEPVFYNAHNEFTWQSTVLLAPLDVNDDDETVRRKIAATATYLDIWIMRRTSNYVRVGYSSVSYAMHLLTKKIRRKSLDELVDILLEQLTLDDVSFDGIQGRGRHGIPQLSINQFSKRYVYHMLARITAYVETQSGRLDLFDKYVDRTSGNPLDIEHIWANHYEPYADQFDSERDFENSRENIAGLVLLPADVNRSFQDKTFEEKAPHYAKQNLYAASLTASAYEHSPQFSKFVQERELPFRPYEHYGLAEQSERSGLVSRLVKEIWSPQRLEVYRTSEVLSGISE